MPTMFAYNICKVLGPNYAKYASYTFIRIRKFWSFTMPNMATMLAYTTCKVCAPTMPSMPSYAFLKIR